MYLLTCFNSSHCVMDGVLCDSLSNHRTPGRLVLRTTCCNPVFCFVLICLLLCQPFCCCFWSQFIGHVVAKTNALLSKCCSCKFKLRFAVVFVFVLGNIYILYGAFFFSYIFLCYSSPFSLCGCCQEFCCSQLRFGHFLITSDSLN